MQVSQVTLRTSCATVADFAALAAIQPHWVLAFGSVTALTGAAPALAQAFAGAHRAGCSTAGEISGAGVEDDTLVVTAVRFARTRVQQFSTVLADMADSFAAGQRLALGLPQDGLRAIVLLGQGVGINGTALLCGMTQVVGPHIPIAGGLAGDGGAFVQTWVLDDAGVSSNRLVCVGLYGPDLVFSCGSYGGWSPFGPARKVTRCENNVLYTVDDELALEVYKKYLGEHAKDLPASGLLFPLAMLGHDQQDVGLIRTILGVDEVQGSLTLAGEIDPQGYLRLMHASTNALVDGAETAAQSILKALGVPGGQAQGLALLVSCVGRKLVMGGRVDEEVEVVAHALGLAVTLAGFYSYGEIGPMAQMQECKLHNQTMTIAFLSEGDGCP